MNECVVLKWFKDQYAKGITKGFTIREVYKALSLTGDKRCIETVWSQMTKLREKRILITTFTIPVRYRLDVD